MPPQSDSPRRLALGEALQVALARQWEGGAVILHALPHTCGGGLEPGDKVVVTGEGDWVGDLPAEIRVAGIEAGREALTLRQSRVYSIDPTPTGGVVRGLEGGSVNLFAEVLPAPLRLIVAGAGHVAQPLAVLGDLLGFAVTVVDDRPEFATRERFPTADEILVTDFVAGLSGLRINRDTFVVLVTRGHVHDQESLRYLLGTEAAYIGMIGSKMRIRTVMRKLRREGFSTEALRSVYAPIGLDIGAQTPVEIAVSIAAEIVDLRRGGKAAHMALKDRLRV